MRRFVCSLLLVVMPLPVMAAATVTAVDVQKGIYKSANCEAADSEACLCEADIVKPVVSGIAPMVAKKINDYYTSMLDPRHIDDTFRVRCDGKKVSVTKAGTQRSFGFQVKVNQSDLLVIATDYSDYEAGQAHGFGFGTQQIFNLKTGDIYTYRALFGDDVSAVNKAISEGILEQKDVAASYVDSAKLESGFNWISPDKLDEEIREIVVTDRGIEKMFLGACRICPSFTVLIPADMIKDPAAHSYAEAVHVSR